MRSAEPASASARLRRRRRVLQGFAGALLAPAWTGVSAASATAVAAATSPTQLNILTSYPDEVMARFEQAFERSHPQYRLRFLWRMPHDALPYLQQQTGGAGAVDVYWAALPRTFAQLAQQRLLRKLELDRAGLPAAIGRTRISDPDGYYLATEVAGYVLAINPSRLAALGVSAPTDWTGLAHPRLLDQIALPVPSEVGFAPVMIDIVLQAYGWQRGWALWSEVAALSRLVHKGATLITDLVVPGEVAIGLSIDFFVNAAIANGAAITARYPLHNGVNPGHVALPLAGAHADGALAFARFVLSAQGQALLLQRDIRKLPVRPLAYVTAAKQSGEAPAFNPFAAAAAGTMNYDGELGQGRLAVISAIFDAMLARPQPALRALWQRVYAAEAVGKDAAQARALLGTAPLDEAQASSDDVRRQVGVRLEGAALVDGGSGGNDNGLRRAWSDACDALRAEADQALARLGA